MPLNDSDAKPSGGYFSAGLGLAAYITFAWKLAPYQARELDRQLPKSVTADFYWIEARAEGNPTKDEMRLMMRSLLADRFKLAVHFEAREVPVLALNLVRPGRPGPRLLPHDEGQPCPDYTAPTSGPPPGKDIPYDCGAGAQMRQYADGVRHIGSRNSTMQSLAGAIYSNGRLAGELDKPVVDETGLRGRFDFSIDYRPGENDRFIGPMPGNREADPGGEYFLHAVREQLGLQLAPSKDSIPEIVIDRVDPPSPN
jgi:uncharacterized protein (TIGR03435 family)